ncbi:MAG TPA: peptidylprolyl isomerase [Ramlibacter sp.]
MKQFVLAAVAAATLALALPAAAQNVAIVNGKPVPMARLEVLKSQLARAGRPATPDMDKMLKDEVITREVFMQEAQRLGLDASADYKDQIELARQTILIRELFADFQKKNPVTDAEIQAEYDKFVAANTGKEYHAHHILFEKEADAKQAIADIKKGKKFEDIAKAKSKDPGSAKNGGDLDWATASSYVPEFSAAMVKLGKGQMTQEPVKTSFGWHVIRVDDIRDAQLPKLAEVKPQIAQELQKQKLQKFQEDLRAKAKVE